MDDRNQISPVSRRFLLAACGLPALPRLLAAQPAAGRGGLPASEVWTIDRLDGIGGYPTKVLGRPRVISTPLGRAVEFNGVEDALFVGNHPLAGAGLFTWEVVFRPDSGGAQEQRFFHLQERDPETGADTESRFLFETRLSGGNWCLDAFVHSGSASKALIDRGRMHPLDRWYHAAMVYDGKGFRSYVNAGLQAKAEVRFTPQRSGHTSIGVRINKVDYFKGAIRLARMSRRALPPSEFLKLKSP